MTPNTYLTAQECKPTWALRRYGPILGKKGGGAAGPLVGPAGVESGAGMMGGGGMSEPQQQQLNVADEAIVTRGNVAAIKGEQKPSDRSRG